MSKEGGNRLKKILDDISEKDVIIIQELGEELAKCSEEKSIANAVAHYHKENLVEMGNMLDKLKKISEPISSKKL